MALKKEKNKNNKKKNEEIKEKENFFTWTAHEFQDFKKDIKWFVIFGAVMAGLIIIAFVLHNWLLAAVLVLSIAVIYLYANKTPEQKSYQISEDTIQIGSKTHPINSFKSFWIAQTPEHNILYLEGAKKFSLPIALQIEDQDVEKAREILQRCLPEQPRGEDIIDKLNRFIRF